VYGEPLAVSSNETAPQHLTAEEFKNRLQFTAKVSSAVNSREIMQPATVNCRRVFSSFIRVFQPYNMCIHQFSNQTA